MRIKSIFGLLVISTLFGCDKENSPEPEPEAPPKVLEFNFRYDASPKEVAEFELILTQKDGKVLLDTLIATKTAHTLRVKSNENKFDVSTIAVNPVTNKYSIKTYIQVNPDKWHVSDVATASVNNNTERSKITYAHVPHDGVFHFQTTQPNNINSSWSNYTQTLIFNRRLPTDLAYIMLPNQGKYLFTEINSAQTDADFSQADNTLKQIFDKPAGIKYFNTSLFGFPTAGDYTKSILLYYSFSLPNQQYDVQYPQSVIGEFTLQNTYIDAEGMQHIYEQTSTTIPLEVAFASKSDFKVTNPAFDGFQVTFEEDKPSTYTVSWKSIDPDLNADWTIYGSPDETTFKPKDYIEKIKSKMLADKNVSAFKLSSIISQQVKGYTHQDLLNHRGGIFKDANKRLKQSRIIQKGFQ